jgi:hypothetical protein
MQLPPNDPGPAPRDRGTLESRPRLDGVTPTQVASFILDVGGRLVRLEAHTIDGRTVVVYTFDVAGKEQSYEVATRDGVVESIAPIFPDAAQPEEALRERLGIEFRPTESSA